MERTMQAKQSSTASGTWRHDEDVVAPLNLDINRYRDGDETPRRRRRDREGEASELPILRAEAEELLSVLHLCATMLGQPGINEVEEHSLGLELGELVDGSWAFLEHLVESKAKSEPSAVTFARPLFLTTQMVDGAGARCELQEREARRGLLTEVHAEAGGEERGAVLERTAAGWVAC
jgi:hypothetical protein